MAQKHINTSAPNDNLGDTLRDANIKCEDNFTELYANKVDKISGKTLSTNDYTTAEKTKLAGIPVDAERNVQADFLVNDPDSDAYIKNKPNFITSINWGEIQGDITSQYDLQAQFDSLPTFEYVDGKISQSINEGILSVAPSEDAIFNALTLKQDFAEKNNPSGYAGLDATGKIYANQLPALAISETFVVASQSAMLALTGAETGDIAVRTDLNKTFILKQSPSSVLGNWQELLTPTDAVTSVFGRVGAVVANAGDYTTALVTETTNKRYQTDVQAARNDATSSIQTQLNGKQSIITNPITGTGTAGFLPKFTGVGSLGNSLIRDTSAVVFVESAGDQVPLRVISTIANDEASIGFQSLSGASSYHVRLGAKKDDFVLFTGNNEKMRVLENGNVGFGTTSPSSKLVVKDPSYDITFEVGTNTTESNILSYNRNSSTYQNLNLRGKNIILSPNDNERVRVLENGNVGIGTNNPSVAFDILKDTNATAFLLRNTVNSFYAGNDADGAFIGGYKADNSNVAPLQLQKFGGNVSIGTANPELGWKLDVNGIVAMGGSAGNGRLYISNENTLNGITNIQARNLTVATPLRYLASKHIFETGNVGIGTTTPTAKLEVRGNGNLISDSTQLMLATHSNTNKQLLLEYNLERNCGVIQSIEQTVNFRNLALNPDGGNVLVGTTTDNGSKLQVNGTISTTGMKLSALLSFDITFNETPNDSQRASTTGIVDVGYGAGYSIVETFKGASNNDGTQRITFTSGTPKGKIYIRIKDSGVWTAWQEVITGTGSLPTSGAYTPTVTAGGNTSGISLKNASYTRIGNIVNVQCTVDFTTAAANTASNFSISIPVIRAGVESGYYVGTGTIKLANTYVPATVYFLSTNNGQVRVEYTSGNGSGGPTYGIINFQYDVAK